MFLCASQMLAAQPRAAIVFTCSIDLEEPRSIVNMNTEQEIFVSHKQSVEYTTPGEHEFLGWPIKDDTEYVLLKLNGKEVRVYYNRKDEPLYVNIPPGGVLRVELKKQEGRP